MALLNRLLGTSVANRPKAEAFKAEGNAEMHKGRFDKAETCYRQSIEADPGYMPAHYNLGNALTQQRRFAEALTAYHGAAELAPDDYEILTNLGVTHKKLGELNEAKRMFDHAAKLAPQALEPQVNAAVVDLLLGNFEAARAGFDAALASAPESAEIHYNRALLLMLLGEWEEGLREHRYRFLLNPASIPDYAKNFPHWDGKEPLAGKTVLVWPEQGFGDQIQCLRYARLLRQQGATQIFVYAHPSLAALLATSNELDLIAFDGGPLPHRPDLMVSDMSLLDIFGPRPNLPPLKLDVYAEATPEIATAHGLKVGVCWQGSPTHERDAERSIPHTLFWEQLSGTSGITFFSLQVDSTQACPAIPLAPLIDEFFDTAVLAQQLDLIVTVDTSLAHLGGTLGIPTWVLVTYSPDWRWGVSGEATPLYESVRIYRQPTPGDWTTLLSHIRLQLETLARQHQSLPRHGN